MHLTEAQVNAGIALYGPLKTLEAHLLINNSKIRTSTDAWEIVRERTTIVDAIIKNSLISTAERVFGFDPVRESNFPFRFGYFAVGGYGRGELSPNSDIDIRLIIDSPSLKDNPLAKAFDYDAIYTFSDKYGLKIDKGIHNLSDIQGFQPLDLNSFLDMRLLYGDGDLISDIREVLKKQGNLSALFLHNLRLLEELRNKHPETYGVVKEFNIKYGIGGLRHYHAALWVNAARSFMSSREISSNMNFGESMRDSVGTLLKMRAELNLQRMFSVCSDPQKRADLILKRMGSTEPDTLKRRDLDNLGQNALEKLIKARKDISRFADSQMKSVLRKGYALTDDFLLTPQGLHIRPKAIREIINDPKEKTKLFFSLVRVAQINGLSINDTVQPRFYEEARNWTHPSTIFGKLFYDQGLRSRSLRYLAERDVLQKILPGYRSLEAGMHPIEHRAANLTRAEFALKKIETRETLTGEKSAYPNIAEEYSYLSPDDAAAIDLALLIKHIPKSNASRGVVSNNLSEYLEIMRELEISTETLDTTHFLVEAHPNVSYEAFSSRLNDTIRVRELANIAKTSMRMRALYLFAHADYGSVEGKEFPLWGDLDELYKRTMKFLDKKPEESIYEANLFDEAGLSLLEDLGPDFRSGRYKETVPFWISKLSKAHKSGEPVVQSFSQQENMIGVACKDYRGLLAVITGKLYEYGADLLQAHAHSLSQHGLALDMFEYTPGSSQQKKIIQGVEAAIKEKTFIDEDPGKILSKSKGEIKLDYHSESSKPGVHHYTFKYFANNNVPGTVYSLTRTLYEKAEANIYGVNAYAFPGRPVGNFIFFSSPFEPTKATKLLENILN